jgi:hypothetical protein
MGKYSKSNQTEVSRQESVNAYAQRPTVQLKDNRLDNSIQLKLIEITNSKKSDESNQRVSMEEEEVQLKGMEEEELQLKGMDEDELQLKRFDEVGLQMKGKEEEELQMKELSDEEIQMKIIENGSGSTISQDILGESVQRVENKTGLPDRLKSGVENLSGYSLDDVKVHYNSDKPTQLNAHAYAQGTDIHLAPGQEKHLPHEAWHVVQQKQGRVRPTRQMKGRVNINDDTGLEAEADSMGAKALQLKGTEAKTRDSKSTSKTVQRSEDTAMTDNRMDALVHRVLAILSVLTAQGEDWEKTYGDKGRKLGQEGVEKAKGALLGGGKKEGPSLKEKVVKEGLKRWWATLGPEEKAEMLIESVSGFSELTSGIYDFFSGGSGKKEKEKEKVKQEEPEKSNAKESKFEADISTKDLEALYDVYKGYGKIKDKINEFELGVRGLAEELGSDAGVKVGEFRNEREFLSKFEEQRVPYKVAKLEFAFLKETIEKNKDTSRYQSELKALSDALDSRLQGPSGMISDPSRFTGDKERMAAAVNTCSIAYENLRIANLVRNGTTSLLSNLEIGVDKFIQGGKKFIGGLFGTSPENQPVDQKIAQKQEELVNAIQTVCNKSWYQHTTGIFAFKPKGVAEIETKLVGKQSAAEKLAEIQVHLVKPEKDLVETETTLSATDDKIGELSGSLRKELTVGKGLSKTRTQKSTEEFVGKQMDNSTSLAELGPKKIGLELKKRELRKKIKGENRKPLTQVFYNEIKSIQPENIRSLGKSISVMNQIAGELDSSNFTK